MSIYILIEDTGYFKKIFAFKTRVLADQRLAEIISEYPDHLRSVEALANDDIYLTIQECKLEEI